MQGVISPREAQQLALGGDQDPGEKRDWAAEVVKKRSEVPARELESGETCCVCCDEMGKDEDLSHCRFG